MTVAMPLTAAKSVTPSVRSRSGAVAWIVDSTCGVNRPAATPRTARRATRVTRFGASAASTEATPNVPAPAASSRRLPYRSPSRPATTSVAANAVVYPESTSCPPETVTPRSVTIAGSSRLTEPNVMFTGR